MKCIACDTEMVNSVTTWAFHCRKCGYWSSRIEVSQDLILNGNSDDKADPKNIENLESVRGQNFEKIIASIKTIKSDANNLLDIGCATGFFIKIASASGINCVGIEPNINMYNVAKKGPGKIINGFFPGALELSEKFDVIIFNDVFEHIEDLHSIIDGCIKHLNENGILIFNLPNSNGILFFLAKFLAFFNISTPWNRLWQTMFYTPHVHYFNPNSLNRLLNKRGFVACARPENLLTFANRDLWGRLGADRNLSKVQRVLYFAVMYPLAWLVNRFKPDIFFAVFKKSN